MWFLASTAYAAAPGAGGGGGGMLAQFLPLILIFVIFWFLVIRPQQKKAKAHRELVKELKKGDEVYTDGGIIGTIQKVSEDLVTLEIAPKVPIRIVRSRITERVRAAKAPAAKGKGDGGKGGSGKDGAAEAAAESDQEAAR